jgi:hypothetical protein
VAQAVLCALRLYACPERKGEGQVNSFVQTLSLFEWSTLSMRLKTAWRVVPRLSLVAMKPQDARVGMRVKVQEHHRIEERRGLVGEVVGCYGEKST